MAGRDATRSLAEHRVYDYPADMTQSWDDYLDLSQEDRKTVNEWVDYYYQKYPEVGILVKAHDTRKVPEEDIFSKVGSAPNGALYEQLEMVNGADKQGEQNVAGL